jgi:hypothetical protein
MSSENKKIGTPLSNAQKRYPELYLHDSVLPDSLLVHVLCEGKLPRDEINKALASSEYFVQPDEEPAWKKVWHGITRPEEEFNAAFTQMEKECANRSFVKTGEIMHVFGLRLWLSEIGQIPLSTDEVVEQCKSYVDDLKKSGKLLVSTEEETDIGTGAYGMGFNKANGLPTLHSYYEKSVEDARRERWPADAASMLELMASNADEFFVKVCPTNDARENTFADTPIFSSIPADVFVVKLLELHPRDFRTVLTAFSGRYETGRLERQLAPELPWLGEVHRMLKAEAEKSSPIRRFRINNEIGRLIAPYLAKPTS